MKSLNLGCGLDKKQDFINVDNSKEVKPDVLWNVGLEPAPFPNNHFDYVEAIHSIEHFENLPFVIEELYRITKNMGVWKIITPFAASYQDNIFHKTMAWHWDSWSKFMLDNPRPYYAKTRLRLLKVEGHSHGWLKYLPFKRKLSSLMNNLIYEIEYTLEVVKW